MADPHVIQSMCGLQRSVCSKCNSTKVIVIASRKQYERDPPVIHRRFECKECGYRFSRKDLAVLGAMKCPKERTWAQLSEAQVVAALTCTTPTKTLAAAWGVPYKTVERVRRREIYAWIQPHLPKWTAPARTKPPERSRPEAVHKRKQRRWCTQCAHWDSDLGRCGLGWPDPLDDGIAYATECDDFTKKELSLPDTP